MRYQPLLNGIGARFPDRCSAILQWEGVQDFVVYGESRNLLDIQLKRIVRELQVIGSFSEARRHELHNELKMLLFPGLVHIGRRILRQYGWDFNNEQLSEVMWETYRTILDSIERGKYEPVNSVRFMSFATLVLRHRISNKWKSINNAPLSGARATEPWILNDPHDIAVYNETVQVLSKEIAKAILHLAPRERFILAQRAEGKTLKEIGQKMRPPIDETLVGSIQQRAAKRILEGFKFSREFLSLEKDTQQLILSISPVEIINLIKIYAPIEEK